MGVYILIALNIKKKTRFEMILKEISAIVKINMGSELECCLMAISFFFILQIQLLFLTTLFCNVALSSDLITIWGISI